MVRDELSLLFLALLLECDPRQRVRRVDLSVGSIERVVENLHRLVIGDSELQRLRRDLWVVHVTEDPCVSTSTTAPTHSFTGMNLMCQTSFDEVIDRLQHGYLG